MPTSARTPTRKALLIGIRYGMYEETHNLLLSSTHKDVERMAKQLRELFGYRTRDITIMKDSEKMKDINRLWPVKENIELQMKELCKDLGPGDRRFFMFSGHGSVRTSPTSLKYSQLIIPVNGFDEDGHIIPERHIYSSTIQDILLGPIKAMHEGSGIVCTFIFDCRNSKDIMGLKPSSFPSTQSESHSDPQGSPELAVSASREIVMALEDENEFEVPAAVLDSAGDEKDYAMATQSPSSLRQSLAERPSHLEGRLTLTAECDR